MKNTIGWLAILIGTGVLIDLAISEKSLFIGFLAAIGVSIIAHELHQAMFTRKHPHQKNRH